MSGWAAIGAAELAFTTKKTLTLLALVDPLLVMPVYLAAIRTATPQQSRQFARSLALMVGITLIVTGLAGGWLLKLLGVSMGSMRVAGGAITFLVAIAMVLAKEDMVKISPAESAQASAGPSLVPLAVPLLVGPASLSYMLATSSLDGPEDLLHILLPPAVVGVATWLAFSIANRAGPWFKPSTANVVERLSGFLLAAISVEMMVAGLRQLFPKLGA